MCISGYKLDDGTKAGLPGWTVTITNATGYTDSVQTGPDGKYEFCGLAPGITYTVTETPQDGWLSVTNPVLNVPLSCTSNSENQNFTNLKVVASINIKKYTNERTQILPPVPTYLPADL